MSRSIKPPSVQAAVIAKKTLGDSNLKIANDLEINRATVQNILEQCNYKQLVEEGKIRVFKMIPKACDAFDGALDRKDVSVATTVLKGCGVLETEQQANVSASVTFVCHIEEPIREVKQA